MLDWLPALLGSPAFLDPPLARIIAGVAAGSIALGFVALALALLKYAQVLRWAKARGLVIGSEPGFDLRQRFNTEAPRNERVAKITYEFEVAGKTWRSNRILDSGFPPEDQTDRLLRDYPKGAAVAVRYHPADPGRSAIEIDHPPKDLALGCLSAIGIVVVFAAIGVWLANSDPSELMAVLPHALWPVMVPAAILSVVFVIGFIVASRHAAALQLWPQTAGQVTRSGVHRFEVRRSRSKRTIRGSNTMRTAYMPVVEYSYKVGGQPFSSRSIWADTEVSGSEKYAQGIAGRYPVGTDVTVRYDPKKPTRTALEIGGSGRWWFLAAAIVAIAITVVSSGLFR